MTDENIAIVLNALADKIRTQAWEIERLQEKYEKIVSLLPPDKLEEITPF